MQNIALECWFTDRKLSFTGDSLPEPVKRMFATVKTTLTAEDEKWEASYFQSNAISVFELMYMYMLI